VFQELCPLPVLEGDCVQLCTFSAAGTYAGSCVRVAPSLVITSDSDIVALRVVGDREFLEDFASVAADYQI
jgi:glutathionylspermidine amidase/synthetase